MARPDSQKIHFVSLGCAKNQVDTEIMLGVSAQEKHALVDNAHDADVIVVNTCGFIESAKEESINAILEMARHKTQGRCKKLVVAGCLSQRYPEELAADLPEVDHFLGSSDMLRLRAVLAGDCVDRMLVGNPAAYTMRATDPRVLSQKRYSAFLKIAEGCNRGCSFCAIPSFRGKQRSRALGDLLQEAQSLAAQGVLELNVISQDTIAWGRDLHEKARLFQLAQALSEIESLRWVRLHYLYPEAIDQELIELFASGGRVLPYLDMPVQHATDAMLQRMRRGYNAKRLRAIIENLKSSIPNLVLRTTFIVGHPGESDDDFAALCDLLKWAEFDHVGVFAYSKEDGTPSANMTDEVAPEIVAQRQQELNEIQRKISRRRLRARVGETIEVLVDGASEESELLMQGRWWGQAQEVDGTVVLANGTAKVGEFRKALVVDASDYDMVADLLDEHERRDAPPDAKRPKKSKLKLATLS